jgi:hypothetical protein
MIQDFYYKQILGGGVKVSVKEGVNRPEKGVKLSRKR